MTKQILCSILIFLCIVPFSGSALPVSQASENASQDRPNLPSFSLTSLSGHTFTEKDLVGKTTLIVFWASWCGTCHEELPKIRMLQEKWAGRPFQVLAIGFRDTEQNISRYVEEHPGVFSFPVFYDKSDTVSARFGAIATPTLFLFDKEGKLVVPYRGGGLLEHPQFQKILAELL